MSTLFPRTLELRRTSPGSYVNGTWVDGTLVVLSFTGSIQPASGKDVQDLEVGRQDVGKVKVYSNTELQVADEGSSIKGDIVVWLDEQWEVLHESKMQNDLINHYKYIAEYRGPA